MNGVALETSRLSTWPPPVSSKCTHPPPVGHRTPSCAFALGGLETKPSSTIVAAIAEHAPVLIEFINLFRSLMVVSLPRSFRPGNLDWRRDAAWQGRAALADTRARARRCLPGAKRASRPTTILLDTPTTR